MKRIVIIGAGQTGRGYLPRFMTTSNYKLTFIDNNPNLVNLMNQDGHYCIHYFHKDAPSVLVQDYNCYLSYSEEASNSIEEADYIFVSVGEQNLLDVAKQINEALEDKNVSKMIMTCENGINPKKKLMEYLQQDNEYHKIVFSQTAVFTTTVVLKTTRLDILSQNEWFFPYDNESLKEFEFKGSKPVANFEQYLERKIYTYNAVAGVISYCGYAKGYSEYAEAANDKEIIQIVNSLMNKLTPCLASYFNISEEEQNDFCQKAKDKWKDYMLIDYVEKNCRAPKRKLGKNERIVKPLNILKANKYPYDELLLVAGCALYFWKQTEKIEEKEMLVQLKLVSELDDISIQKIYNYYKIVKANFGIIELLKVLKGADYE